MEICKMLSPMMRGDLRGTLPNAKPPRIVWRHWVMAMPMSERQVAADVPN